MKIDAAMLVGGTTHFYSSFLLISAIFSCRTFSASQQHFKVQAGPTHSCLYIYKQLAITPEVSYRLDGRSIGDEPPLPVAANDSTASMGRRQRGVGAWS